MSKDEKEVKTKAAKPSKQKKNDEFKIFSKDGIVNQSIKENK